MTYPPQPPPPFPGQPPQGYGRPRRGKSKTGLIAGIAVVVLLLLMGVFVITGFVAPGFLLDDSTSQAGPGPDPQQRPQPEPWCEAEEPNEPNIPDDELPSGDAGGLYVAAERLTQAVAACNDAAGRAEFCDPATWPTMAALGEGYRLMFLGKVYAGKDAPPNADGSAEYQRTEQGKTEAINLGFLKQGDRWCVGTRK